MAHYDSWPDYPMSCGAIFRFRGEIRREVFDEAVEIANRRHPLLEAHVTPDSKGRLCWEPSSKRLTVQWIGEGEATSFDECEPFDLRYQTGVRLWVQQRGPQSSVFTEFHHTCCDGAGGLSYMEDIFACYARLLKDGACSENDLPPNDPFQLARRGIFRKPKQSWNHRARSLVTDLMETSRNIAVEPVIVGLGQRRLNPKIGRQQRRFVTRIFSREACTRMRKLAATAGATMNDYLLNALTVVVRRSLRADATSQPMRILVPVNLRGRDDLQMGLTNRMSYAFVERPSNVPTMQIESLQSVAAQTATARHAQLPIRLLEKLSLVQSTGLWALALSRKRCLATAAFSNLGDPSRRFRTRFPREGGHIRIGNLVMYQFEGTTALRPNTRAGLFVNTYGNQLSISVRLDPHYFNTEDAEQFLDRFATQINASPQLSRAA